MKTRKEWTEMYKEPKPKSKPVPAPNFMHIFKDAANRMYDKVVKPAAKPSTVSGYNDSGVSKKDYGI
jgi:hypothetical protein